MPEKNYHSRLLDVSKNFDHVIERMKASYVDKKIQQAWIFWLLLSPVRDLAKIKDIQDGFLKFLNSSVGLSLVPLISTVLGPTVFMELNFPVYTKNLIAGSIGYLFSMFFYFPLMLNFKSDHFHIGAYKFFRKQEYNLFRSAFLDNTGDFYFKGLYDHVTHSGNVHQLVDKRLSDFLHNERSEYKSEIKSLEDKLQVLTDNSEIVAKQYDEFSSQLIEERDEVLREMEYLIKLLKDINMLLFRKFNGEFSKKDLSFLTGYTIYELRGNELVRIEDVLTSGSSPKVIHIKDKKYANYGTVKVALDSQYLTPFINNPYPGHVVVSFRMNMDNKGVWIFNFHFDTSDNRLWKLLSDDGTIESREIYRLVHALCLLSLEDDYFAKKEAVNQ